QPERDAAGQRDQREGAGEYGRLIEGNERDIERGGRETEPRNGRVSSGRLEDGDRERDEEDLDDERERGGRLIRMANQRRGGVDRQQDDDGDARSTNRQVGFPSGIDQRRVGRQPEATPYSQKHRGIGR